MLIDTSLYKLQNEFSSSSPLFFLKEKKQTGKKKY